MEALREVAPERGDRVEGALVFDALGDDGQVERVREGAGRDPTIAEQPRDPDGQVLVEEIGRRKVDGDGEKQPARAPVRELPAGSNCVPAKACSSARPAPLQRTAGERPGFALHLPNPSFGLTPMGCAHGLEDASETAGR